MRATVITNTIPLQSDRAAIEKAVLDAIGERPEHESWRVRIDEPFDRPDYIIDIEGPGFKWRRGFFGPHEQTAEFICGEVKRALAPTAKATVVPLHFVRQDIEITEPFVILESVTIENVQDLLSPDHLQAWRDQISPRSHKKLSSAKLALVHRFSSDDLVGLNEENSKDLLFKIFTFLRLIKPTREEFAFAQAKVGINSHADIFRVVEPPPVQLNLPVSELINLFHLTDFIELKAGAGAFLEAMASAPDGLLRAIRFFNLGYQGVYDSVIQVITWVMGIEAIYNSGSEPMRQQELLDRISECVGAETDLYSESAMSPYFGPSARKVEEVLSDLFDLRNNLVHGLWIPNSLQQKIGHRTLGGSPVPYADALREAAFHILRMSIVNFLRGSTGKWRSSQIPRS